MAVYQFSALADGQSVAFNPTADVLRFDQSAIGAADIRITAEGSHLRVSVASGTFVGKDILLLNTAPTRLSTGNTQFVDGSRLVVGDNNPATTNDGLANTLWGNSGRDHLAGLGGNDTLSGLVGNDRLDGGDGNDSLAGGDGIDILIGGAGVDVLNGGAGSDQYVFASAPGSANADMVQGFASGADKIVLDNSVFAAVGGAGNFAAGDGRFNAGAGFTSGQDSNDRVIYNTSTGQLFYDADGSGSGGAQLIATLQGNPTISATDVAVVGLGSGSGGGGGEVINGTSGNDSLNGTTGDDTINGLAGNDTLNANTPDGNEGTDYLSGGDGNDVLDAGRYFPASGQPFTADTLDGGLGDDEYHVSVDGDVIVADPGGIDTVFAWNTNWTLGAGLDNLHLIDTEGSGGVGIGNELDNLISGGGEFAELRGMGGDDRLQLANAFNFSRAFGGDGNDTLSAARDSELFGDAGNDVLIADGRGSTMTGGSGGDSFVFGSPSGSLINDFASGADKIRLDATSMQALGASGNFAAGDVRFHAAPGATGGHDADDRVIYDTTNGLLLYDADGSGSGAAQLITRLQPGTPVVATDIAVDNGTTAPPDGQTINGTSGNDSLTGTFGDETINGLGGNDTINGVEGNDRLNGGDGNDLLFGGENPHVPEDSQDTLDGGLGDDTFNVYNASFTSQGLVLLDAGGLDTVIATSWTLGSGFENLILRMGMGESGEGVGNALNNVIRVESTAPYFYDVHGGDGNDTLIGGGGTESLFGGAGDDVLDAGVDNLELNEMTGGAGQDDFVFRSPPPESFLADVVHDFASSVDELLFDNNAFTALGGAGDFTAGDARFLAAPGASSGQNANHRLIYDTSSGDLYYDADGSGGGASIRVAALAGAPNLQATDISVIGNAGTGGQTFNGTAGNDSLTGGAGNDTMFGLAGNDTLRGAGGNDSMNGGDGTDSMDGGRRQRHAGRPLRS